MKSLAIRRRQSCRLVFCAQTCLMVFGKVSFLQPMPFFTSQLGTLLGKMRSFEKVYISFLLHDDNNHGLWQLTSKSVRSTTHMRNPLHDHKSAFSLVPFYPLSRAV